MGEKLFREEAEQAETGPDALSDNLSITTPKTWLAVLAITLLLAGAVAGAFLIRVPIQVKGTGIVLGDHDELLLTVPSPAEGRLAAILVRTEQKVGKGDIIARIDRAGLKEKLAGLRQSHADLLNKQATILKLQKETAAKEEAARKRQLAAINQAIGNRRKQLAELKIRHEKERKLKNKGFITEQNYLKTLDEISRLQEEIADREQEKKKIAQNRTEKEAQYKRERIDLQLQISQAEQDIAQLEDQISRTTVVRSDHDGTVAEIDAAAGDLVQAGQPLIRLLPARHGDRGPHAHNGIVYVPLDKGKQIKPGMPVLADLTTVRKELYGQVKARVVSVSDTPSTPENVARVLDDPSLSKVILQNGAVFAVKVAFESDPSSPSGYAWTSGRGPDVTVTPGTSFSADITTERARIITLLIPALRGLISGPQQ